MADERVDVELGPKEKAMKVQRQWMLVSQDVRWDQARGEMNDLTRGTKGERGDDVWV